MQPIVMEPLIDPKSQPFYAKLRVEADADLLNDGAGKLYLGFHLDPFHAAHWNNLTPPLKYKLELPLGAKIAKSTGEATKVSLASDADPREFLIDVEDWPADKPIKVVVAYSACKEEACYAIRQEYVIRLKRDKDGGGARGEGAGFWDAEQFAKQMMARDKTGRGKLSKDEVMGLVLPHFDYFDKNKDGFLDLDELKEVSKWLNEHHRPGLPEKQKK
jgi:hypothetical protein